MHFQIFSRENNKQKTKRHKRTTAINHTEWQNLLRIRFSFVLARFFSSVSFSQCFCYAIFGSFMTQPFQKSLQHSLKNEHTLPKWKICGMINSFGNKIEFYSKRQRRPMFIGQVNFFFHKTI